MHVAGINGFHSIRHRLDREGLHNLFPTRSGQPFPLRGVFEKLPARCCVGHGVTLRHEHAGEAVLDRIHDAGDAVGHHR